MGSTLSKKDLLFIDTSFSAISYHMLHFKVTQAHLGALMKFTAADLLINQLGSTPSFMVIFPLRGKAPESLVSS